MPHNSEVESPRAHRWAGAILLSAIWTASVVAELAKPAHTFLQDRLGFTTGDLSNLERGRPVARTLKAEDRREIAVGGAVRVDVPVDFFLHRFSDIVAFKQSKIVRQIGKFSSPPRRDDLSRLTFDSTELEALRKCRVDDCGLYLSEGQIRRINAGVDWGKPDARERASNLLREMLVEYVQAYRSGGNAALLEYRAGPGPVSLANELQHLVDHSGPLLDDSPEFRDYLLGLSNQSLRSDEEFVYWSKEQFGLKPVISITHVVVYKTQRATVPEWLIASKQIYASRYFGGSLALTLAIPGALTGPSFYMVYSNRTHPVSFPPVLGGLVRRVAQAQTRSGLEDTLRTTKERLESDYRRQ